MPAHLASLARPGKRRRDGAPVRIQADVDDMLFSVTRLIYRSSAPGPSSAILVILHMARRVAPISGERRV